MYQVFSARRWLVTGVALGLTAPSIAAGQQIYGVAELAQSRIDDKVDIGGVDLALDESATGFRFALGYEWNDHLALEAGYTNLGETDFDSAHGAAEAESDGVELAFLFRWPVADRFSLTGRAGYLWWDGETRVSGASVGESGGDLLFGAGGEFKATEQFSITLGWRRYQLDDLDVDYAAVGIRLRFGRSR